MGEWVIVLGSPSDTFSFDMITSNEEVRQGRCWISDGKEEIGRLKIV
jgi:hypothetical protein